MRQRSDYTEKLESHIGNYANASQKYYLDKLNPDKLYDTMFEEDRNNDEDLIPQETFNESTLTHIPDAEEYLSSDNPIQEANDETIGTTIDLPVDGNILGGRIVSRKRDASGDLVGTKNQNPILDSRIYIMLSSLMDHIKNIP